MPTKLTERDEDIMKTLTLRVHLVTLEQAASYWWTRSSSPSKQARHRLRQLEQAGLVARHRVNIHPLLALSRAVLIWLPGDTEPAFGAVSYQLRKRWTKPLELTTVFIATKKTANLMGGFGGKFKHRTQLTHDTHLAEIYFRLAQRKPTIRDHWKGEELFGKDNTGKKVPDAIIAGGNGKARRVIEFGGAYGKARVIKFHRFCAHQGLPYELW